MNPHQRSLETACSTFKLCPYKMEESGFEPLNPKERIYSPSRLALLATPPVVACGIQNRNCRHMELQSIAQSTKLSYRRAEIWCIYNNNETVWTGLEPATSFRVIEGQYISQPTELPNRNGRLTDRTADHLCL